MRSGCAAATLVHSPWAHAYAATRRCLSHGMLCCRPAAQLGTLHGQQESGIAQVCSLLQRAPGRQGCRGRVLSARRSPRLLLLLCALQLALHLLPCRWQQPCQQRDLALLQRLGLLNMRRQLRRSVGRQHPICSCLCQPCALLAQPLPRVHLIRHSAGLLSGITACFALGGAGLQGPGRPQSVSKLANVLQILHAASNDGTALKGKLAVCRPRAGAYLGWRLSGCATRGTALAAAHTTCMLPLHLQLLHALASRLLLL